MAKRKLLISLVILLSSTASAEGGWVKDWYDNVYEQRIAPQQQQMIMEEELGECGAKLHFYQQKVIDNPDSEYFKYKLEKWTERCQ